MTSSRAIRQTTRRIFLGAQGLRAGWSILLFAGIFALVFVGLAKLVGHFTHSPRNVVLHVQILYVGEGMALVSLFAAVCVMSAIERRSPLAFGFQGDAKRVRFLTGAALGVVAMSFSVLVLVGLHAATLDVRPVQSADLVPALSWAGGFLLVGLFEESALRGYLQYTLARGIGFWWSAIALSILFGAIHGFNANETHVGVLVAAAFGFVFCMSLWYTGSLFWAIGFHAAWDWTESYLFGALDSGASVEGHLFSLHPAGHVLLSGGTVGPEGSIVQIPILAAIALLMKFWWGRRATPVFGMRRGLQRP
jgi:uncharacterized protein